MLNEIRRKWLHVSLIAFVLIMVAIWITWFVPNIHKESARWTLSALVQGMSTILGLAFVAEVFIAGELTRLRALDRNLNTAELELERELRRARGWEAGVILLMLVASIVSGLMVLSGYNENTSRFALIFPVCFGVASTLSIVILFMEILGHRADYINK